MTTDQMTFDIRPPLTAQELNDLLQSLRDKGQLDQNWWQM